MAWLAKKLAAGLLRLGAGLAICATVSVALADPNIRDPRLDQALMLAENGQSAAAIALSEAALGDAASDRARWFAHETVATIVHLDGDDVAALPMLREVVATGEALFGRDGPQLIYPLRMLAATQGNLGDDVAVTRTMLRSLRLARSLAQSDRPAFSAELLACLSDLSRHYLDTGDNLAAALLAAELTIESQSDEEDVRLEAAEGEMLLALAYLRMGRPVDAASHLRAASQIGDITVADRELFEVLDTAFSDQAGAEPEAKIAEWFALADAASAERAAREAAAVTAGEPMVAALLRGDPVAADLAARSAFDRTNADDPVAVLSYFALMTGTYRVGRIDLAATWAKRLADMPPAYLASFAEDPSLIFQGIAAQLLSEGRAGDAARLSEATINLWALRGGAQDVVLQSALQVYGAALRDMGEPARAEQALQRAVDIGAVPGPEPARSRTTLRALGDLADLYRSTDSLSEAREKFENAITLLETGVVGQETAAWIYILQQYLPILAQDGQRERALSLAVRALAIAQTDGATEATFNAYVHLAQVHFAFGDFADSILAADQAIAIAGAEGGLDTASARIIAASARFDLGDVAGANAILSSVVSGGVDATLLALTAVDRAKAGDLANAQQLLAHAIAGLPQDSPVLPNLKAVEGVMLLWDGDIPAALAEFRIATQALTQPDRRSEPGSRRHLPFHVDAALKMAEAETGVQSLNYATEAFQVAQRVNDISAGAALGRTAARLRVATPDAGLRARDVEDAGRALTLARDRLVARLGDGRDAATERAILDRARLSLGQAEDALSLVFPEYRSFADPAPLDLAATIGLLGPEEVLVLFATSDMEGVLGADPSVVIALTSEGYVWSPLPPSAEIVALTAALRCAAALTDHQCGTGSAKTRGAFSLLDGVAEKSAQVFDYDLAYRAYLQLLDPVAATFEGKTSLIVVPDKALAALPVHLLLTAAAAPATSPRDAPWLIRKMAVSIAPSVSSWAALRDKAVTARKADLPFLGFGDPLIGIQRNGPVPMDCARYTEPALLSAALATTGNLILRDATVPAGAIAALPALPETRCELEAISAYFGGGSRLLLHGDANEAEIKSMSRSGELSRFRILSFATHGLLAGELGENQAGLVLTPPKTATVEDDGILTIEDIAGLRINADFVLLSACNTAAGSQGGDDSLSGLASAFFLAGARGLLVSHWPVYSDAAVRLTTGMFGAQLADPKIGYAQALQRSMLGILDDPTADAMTLHPAYWGPFMIVGDGYAN